MAEFFVLLFIATLGVALLAGYPVAFTLGGISLLFALLGSLVGIFDDALLLALPSRIFGLLNNSVLIAVPMFVFMGTLLERSGIAEDLLDALSESMERVPGGLAMAVLLVGSLLAASTGIVGATVVTLGLLALPTMLRRGYDRRLATGIIAATGTLGQIIPPSIALILLADVVANAYQQAQLSQGIFSINTVSVGQLFMGALLPGLALALLYGLYLVITSWRRPNAMPAVKTLHRRSWPMLLVSLALPLLLVLMVLGSILTGVATPTEASSIGAGGILLLALARRRMDWGKLLEASRATLVTTSMVFTILIGATVFSLVFRGYGGDDMVSAIFAALPGGAVTAMLMVMLVVFVLGFVLDFIEIIYIVVPIMAPAILALGIDPVWFAVMLAVNLQTSFLTPPFGFALFYLRGVASKQVTTSEIYAGVLPFIAIQILMLLLLTLFPALATWLPALLYG